MAERAHVTSVDAIKSFKTSLIVYLSKARPALEEVSADVLRVRLWLQDDQRIRWEGEIRRRVRKLEDAQQALFSARIASLREVSSAEQVAVTRTKRSLEEAENKLRIAKRWTRDFDSRVDPMAKQLEKLQTMLSEELPKAVAYLTQAINSLDAYANVAPPIGEVSASPASGDATPETGKSVIPKENGA
jgi:hypothetical protein